MADFQNSITVDNNVLDHFNDTPSPVPESRWKLEKNICALLLAFNPVSFFILFPRRDKKYQR